ncbi:phage tail protein [Buttiauxella sp. A2-C1_F]|uniref:phage tail protein n=1 Tax=Buttiauxella sp. A2-C1_F TaxID=2904526 RepID=UPI001E5497F0|nr:phage tail protein [Buttiauxella sp. A2-C1_F]MCE0846039.1 phage tail protein [Buttiauxella sp. A2-C1_F]
MVNIQGRKGGGGNAQSPKESPDSLHSVATAKILLALGEGECAGGLTDKDIYLDGTPVRAQDGTLNFPGVTWEYRPGTQAQEYIQGIPSVENEISINTPLKQTQPWTRAISNTQLSALRIRLGLPALQKQKDNGDVVGSRVEYKIELATDGGAYQAVVNGAFDGKTTSLYERSHRIDLPKATTGWQVRVTRITADSVSNRIADATNIEAYAEVIDAKLRYPNTELLFVTFDAKQFSNIPQISVKAPGRLIRVPTAYDADSRTYSGTWDGSFKWAYSNNPAWVFYDMVLNPRFGLGDRLDASQVDKWELYRIAQYCDQLVPDGLGGSGTEPRFLCDVYIQSQNEAFNVLRDLASIFRGMTYWANNQLFALADQPRDMTYVFTRANVIGGKFVYAGGSERNRYSTAMVSWSNPDNHYADEVEGVFEQDLIRRYKVRQTEITAIGCTRRTEANRRGRWTLLTNAKDRLVTFSTGMEGMIPLPGYIIGVADQNLSGKVMGGRISAVNGRVITLDRVGDAKAGNRLIINLPSGVSQARTIQSVTDKQVTVTTAYSETPEVQSVWVVDADDLFIQQYRVTGVTDNDDGTFTIAAINHNPDKYAAIDTGARLDDRPISAIPPGVQAPPAAVTISSYSRVVQNISVETLRVNWEAVPNAIAYECEWRKDNGDWVNAPRTSSLGFEVTGIYSGRYTARVRAINSSDISSVWTVSQEANLTGKIGSPPKPLGLSATDDVVFGINISWGFPADAGDTLNTEIQYSATADGTSPMLLADVPYPQKLYQQMGLKAGQNFWYRARLIDRIGNQGEWTEFVGGQASIDVSDITEAVLNQIKDTDIFKDLVENAVDSNLKIADMASAIIDNADKLAAAAGANKQTAESIIHNALAIANVVVSQSAQNGANSAKFEQLREVLATETEARVTDVTRLEAKVTGNEAGITEVRQALATETEARATAVDELTAKTGDNAAGVSLLTQAVTTLDSSTTSRFEELSGKTDNASGGIQNTSIALIQNTLAQVSLRQTITAQYGSSIAQIQRIDETTANDREANARSLLQLESKVNGNGASITNLSQTVANYQQATASQVTAINASINGVSAAVTTNASALANIDGALNAMYSIKVGIDKNGRKYAAGMGIGVENTPEGMQSQILFLADRFAVMAQAGGAVTLPFVIVNGQAIIRDTVIGDATISNAKIGSFIQSNNYVANTSGWRLDKDGAWFNFGSDGAGARKSTNVTDSVRDENGVLRCQWGKLTGVF